jgi:hypothetical protein
VLISTSKLGEWSTANQLRPVSIAFCCWRVYLERRKTKIEGREERMKEGRNDSSQSWKPKEKGLHPAPVAPAVEPAAAEEGTGGTEEEVQRAEEVIVMESN